MKQEIQQINTDVKNMAEDLVSHMNNILPKEYKLDYSEQSLKIIDVFIEKLRSEGSDERKAENEIMAIGAYVGEILKSNFGGHWTKPELAGFPKDGATYSVVLIFPNGVSTNPLGRVLKYFRHGNSYAIVPYYEMTKSQIQQLP
jgi:hypothetical protein